MQPIELRQSNRAGVPMNRRQMFGGAFGAAALLGSSGWLRALADNVANASERRRSCILLWMSGGPSQLDTFDLKPGHANGGAFKEIDTAAPGLRFSEHLPQLAAHGKRLAVVRSLSTKEGDHGRATQLMRTGFAPGGPVPYPTLGALVAKELGDIESELPYYVAVSPSIGIAPAAFSPGFLGPEYAPTTVTRLADGPTSRFARLGVDFLTLPEGVDRGEAERRLELWRSMQGRFLVNRAGPAPAAHQAAYERASRMVYGNAAEAFDLTREPDEVREAYGPGAFGQGCLVARRLVERGVPFVEVTLSGEADGGLGWDTHQNNFELVKNLSGELDAGWASLMRELDERGLLDTTTILWMGEFGRTPVINNNAGRDHFPAAWSCVFAGGGIQGGQALGSTGADGMAVESDQVGVGDVIATLASALGIDPYKENIALGGRPIRFSGGAPIKAILS